MEKLKHFIHTSVAILLLLLTSCVRSGKVEYKQTIIKDKTVDLQDGSTRYNIAFIDGSSESVSFGLYSKYQIGDTVCWKREKDFWFWTATECD